MADGYWRFELPHALARGLDAAFGRFNTHPLMTATKQVVVGFITLIIAAMVGWFFAGSYHRIGPEVLEPVVLIVGSAAIISLAAFGFLQLVRGIKRLQ